MKQNIRSLQVQRKTDETAQPRPSTQSAYPSAITGRLSGIAEDGSPLVDWPNNEHSESLPALTLTPIEPQAIGCRCALVFEQGDPRKPIILGLLQESRPLPRDTRSGLAGTYDQTWMENHRPLLPQDFDENSTWGHPTWQAWRSTKRTCCKSSRRATNGNAG